MQKITDLFYGMKLFDSGGDYFGRVWEIDEANQSLTYLTPTQGTHTLGLIEAKRACSNGFWLRNQEDPAVQLRWKHQNDIPASKPGLTFEDGLALGKQQAAHAAKSVPAPYDWLYEEAEPFTLSGDDFNDGYQSGFRPEFRRLLLEKFPASSHKPEQQDKTWKNTKWGIDRDDPVSVASFEKGQKMADDQKSWLPELQADASIQEFIDALPPVELGRLNIVAFRFGFKSRMEGRFPNRY